jgi:hypothetical protein
VSLVIEVAANNSIASPQVGWQLISQKEFDKGRKLVRMSIATNTPEIHISDMLMLSGKEK